MSQPHIKQNDQIFIHTKFMLYYFKAVQLIILPQIKRLAKTCIVQCCNFFLQIWYELLFVFPSLHEGLFFCTKM